MTRCHMRNPNYLSNGSHKFAGLDTANIEASLLIPPFFLKNGLIDNNT